MATHDLDVSSAVTTEALQVTGEAPGAVPSWPYTPRAILGPSLNRLTVCPPVPAGAKGWDVLQTVAGAEFGYIRKGRDGIIRFSNRQQILAAAVAREITSKTSLKSLGTSVPPSGASRRILVPYTEWDFATDPTAIFVLQSNKKIPRGQTVEWEQPITDGSLVAAIDTTLTLLPDGHDPTDGGSYYRSSGDKHGISKGPALTATARLLDSARIKITVIGSKSRDAWLTTPSTNTDFGAGDRGSGLWIGGYVATSGDEATVPAVYGNGKGELRLDSNPYRQDHDLALADGWFLLAQLFMDIRDFTDVSIVPDLRVEPADLLHLVNPDPSHVYEYVLCWGWSYSADFPPAGQEGGSRDMSLNVRALAPPDAWLIGSITDRADINATAWLYV